MNGLSDTEALPTQSPEAFSAYEIGEEIGEVLSEEELNSISNGASYVAFGSFFKTSTKKIKYSRQFLLIEQFGIDITNQICVLCEIFLLPRMRTS